MSSPYPAGRAKPLGKSGETTPGTRNAKPINRKLCRTSSGRRASARGWSRSAGQRYRAAMIPQATKLTATLIPKRACGGTTDSLPQAYSCCLTGSVVDLVRGDRPGSSSSSAQRASAGDVEDQVHVHVEMIVEHLHDFRRLPDHDRDAAPPRLLADFGGDRQLPVDSRPIQSCRASQ